MHAYLPFWLAVDGMHPCAPSRTAATLPAIELNCVYDAS